MSRKLILFFLSIVVFSSCVKDTPAPVPIVTIPANAKKVYVVNEGNFNSNNSGITVFDPASEKLVEDEFKTQNSVSLGDVAQSMCKINGDFYIVVNNSGKIVVCDADLKIKRTITALTSPRYILAVSNQKAYVSDLYANGLSIVDLNTGTKTGSISLPGKTEQMAMLYSKVYVTNTAKDKVYVIDAATNTLTDSISVGINAGSLVFDKNDKLWVLSSGTQSVAGKMSLIDPTNNTVIWTQNFNATNERPAFLCINGTKDTLFYANKDGVCRMPITATSLPNAFILSQSNIYGLGIHPTRFEVYVADAVDYISKSKIYIYKTSTGGSVKNFNAGFISNGFYFE
jgi:YVTN family beta-propeller protein